MKNMIINLMFIVSFASSSVWIAIAISNLQFAITKFLHPLLLLFIKMYMKKEGIEKKGKEQIHEQEQV